MLFLAVRDSVPRSRNRDKDNGIRSHHRFPSDHPDRTCSHCSESPSNFLSVQSGRPLIMSLEQVVVRIESRIGVYVSLLCQAAGMVSLIVLLHSSLLS